MKKLFMALMLCLISISSYSENLYGYTIDCQVWNGDEWILVRNGNGISITVTDDRIYVNSAEPQIFYMSNISDWHVNQSGHDQYTADAMDQDGNYCTMRIVARTDLSNRTLFQIYISYNNIQYVYTVQFRNLK